MPRSTRKSITDAIISDRQVWNCFFFKFLPIDTILRDYSIPGRSSDLDHDALRDFVEWNQRKSTRELALDLNASQSTWKKKKRRVSKLDIWLPQTLFKKNKEDQLSIAKTFLSKLMLYSRNTNISRNIIKHNLRTSMNERTHFFIKIYLSHFILERVDVSVVCERWVETRADCYTDPTSLDHSALCYL